MNPLQVTKTEFSNFKHKVISIRYEYEPTKFIEVSGHISEIYLASNPPHEVGSFDFELNSLSKEIVKKASITIPHNIGIFEISDISVI